MTDTPITRTDIMSGITYQLRPCPSGHAIDVTHAGQRSLPVARRVYAADSYQAAMHVFDALTHGCLVGLIDAATAEAA